MIAQMERVLLEALREGEHCKEQTTSLPQLIFTYLPFLQHLIEHFINYPKFINIEYSLLYLYSHLVVELTEALPGEHHMADERRSLADHVHA